MTNGALRKVLGNAPPTWTWSELTAPKIMAAMSKVKIQSIQERSQKRISNHAICKSMKGLSVPTADLGEKHVFEVGGARGEAVVGGRGVEHVQGWPSAHEAAGNNPISLLVGGQV